MRDYMKALCCRFETTSRRAEYLDRKSERTYGQLTRLLDEPERKLLLKMADLEDALREKACLNSFISGYRVAQGIQRELADPPLDRSGRGEPNHFHHETGEANQGRTGGESA